MRYHYILVNPDKEEVIANGRLHFLNRRTIADAIRRKTGRSTTKGEALIIQVSQYVWELQLQASGRVLIRAHVTENKYAEKA